MTDQPAEVAHLQEIIRALMDRAERSTLTGGSEYTLFQQTIMLQEQVRRRTAELEEALRANEKINRHMRESEARFCGLAGQSLVGIMLVENGSISYSNEKLNEMFGFTGDELRALPAGQLAVPADRPLVLENMRRRLSGEQDRSQYWFHGLRKDGEIIDVECHGSVMHLGEEPILITMIMDVTERVKTEREVLALQERLREQSTHDPLTGLYNRRYLDDYLDRALMRARDSGEPLALIMGDVDRFKAINDRHGHLAGDEVLRALGDLFRRQARATDICCRYGGEEFLLVLPRTTLAQAQARAEQLRQAVANTVVESAAAGIRVTSSFGVACFPSGGQTSDQLIGAADAALYEAKRAGRNRVALPGDCAELKPCEFAS